MESKWEKIEKKAFDMAKYQAKLDDTAAGLALQKIYAIYKNQGFDFAIIHDNGALRYNMDRLKYKELIATENILDLDGKYGKRLATEEYSFLKYYVEYGWYSSEEKTTKQKTKIKSDIKAPKDTEAYHRLCRHVIGQEDMKRTLCKLGAVYQFAKKREDYHLDTTDIHKVLAFIGPPGTAKTTSARYFAEMMTEEEILQGGRIAYVTGTQLKAKYVGQTSERVHQIFEQNDIIIIDEAYSLVNYNETDRTDNFSQEALAQLCIEVEDHSNDKLIIFAGYGGDVHDKSNKMKRFLEENPGIASRITFTVHFSAYKPEEMLDIFSSLAGNTNFLLEKGWEEILLPFFEERVKDPTFGNGREARRILEHAMAVAAERFMEWYPTSSGMTATAREKEERKRLSTLTCDDLRGALGEFQAYGYHQN